MLNPVGVGVGALAGSRLALGDERDRFCYSGPDRASSDDT